MYKYVVICIKCSCIEQKMNTVAEDVRHWDFAFTVYYKHFCYILNCSKQALHGKY